MSEKGPLNKTEFPKVNFYLIHVDDLSYDVRVANCPICGEQNTDVESGVTNTCLFCKKQFEVGEVDKKKSQII